MTPTSQICSENTDLDGIQMKLCNDQTWLIEEQDEQIKELLQQLADYEQQLYEKDYQIHQLHAEIGVHKMTLNLIQHSYRRELL